MPTVDNQPISHHPPIAESRRRILQSGIIAILRGRFTSNQLMSIADALVEGGISAMEVTLNSDNAPSHIRSLRERFDDRIFIGAGTIRTASDVDLAINAGAQYLISPGFDRASVERSHELGVLHLPGVFTATEAMNAFEAGCLLLKLFPAEMFGPPYLKSLRAPLDDVKFVPTGGVTAENIGAWRRAGASAVGVASSLVSGPDQPAAQIVERARALRAGWESSANA